MCTAHKCSSCQLRLLTVMQITVCCKCLTNFFNVSSQFSYPIILEKGSQDLMDLHLEAEGPLRDHHQSQNLGQQETDLKMNKGLSKIDPSINIDLVHQEIGLRKSKDLWKSKDIWKIDRLNNIDRPGMIIMILIEQ